MNGTFSRIIRTIEAEIKAEFLGGAIAWADEKFDNAWSNALDRFDNALTEAIKRMDYHTAEIEGELYLQTVLDLLKKYKAERKMNDLTSLLTSIQVGRH